MRHTIRTLSLPAVVLALAGGALAQQPPAHATRIPFADIGNIGGRWGGAITAAYFLKEWAGDTPWVHLDIAAVMDATSDSGVLVKGNTGRPVRTLVHWVLGRARG